MVEESNNIIVFGINVLKDLKLNFKEKAKIEKDIRIQGNFIRDLESMKNDEEISYDDFVDYSQEIYDRIDSNNFTLSIIMQKIYNDIENLNKLNQDVISYNIKLPSKWYRLVSKVQGDIQNFMLEGNFDKVKQNKGKEANIENKEF